MRTTDPPVWAQALLAQVAQDYQKPVLPLLTWCHSSKHNWSSGRYFYGPQYPRKRIHVTAGGERWKQKMTLLHEIAHWLAPQSDHHSPRFWDLCLELYRRYHIPLHQAVEFEALYRKEALHAAERAGVRIPERIRQKVENYHAWMAERREANKKLRQERIANGLPVRRVRRHRVPAPVSVDAAPINYAQQDWGDRPFGSCVFGAKPQ